MSKTVRTIVINLIIIAVLTPAMYWGAVEYLATKLAAKVEMRRKQNNVEVNQGAWLASSAQGFNPANTYWVVPYNCRQHDVEVRGTVPEALYWSMVAYDRYTMPLDSYIYDETVQKDSSNNYVAYLTTSPKGRANEIDVSPSPEGILIIRTSYPVKPEEVLAAVPQVKPLSLE